VKAEKRVIGNAELWLGDCREVVAYLPDKSVDMVFTDPPYGHNNNDGDLISNREKALGKAMTPATKEATRPILNDGEEAEPLVYEIFAQMPRILKSGGSCCCCCCCGGGGPDPMFARWSLEMDKHLEFKQMIVWDKGPMGMGWHYRRSYETVLVATKRGGACKWYDETNAIENIIRPGSYGIRKIIPQADEHPTPKPHQLPAHFIRLHSQEGEMVLDPFMGGGSTAIAALELGRKFIGVELDPRWFDMASRRVEDAQKQMRLF